MNILVVDDVPANRRLLRAQLEAEGLDVTEAPDGVEALARLEAGPVDAVIADVLMPNMDGYRLCHEVRKSERFNKLPFIIYTSTYCSPSDRALAETVGADSYIVKPAPVAAVLTALAEAGGKHRAPRSDPAEPVAEIYVVKQYNETLVAKLEERNRDLTEAHEAVVASEERFRQLAENVREIFWLTDLARTTMFYVSPAYEQIWGRSRAALYADPRSWLSAVHPEDRARFEATAQALSVAGGYEQEYRVVRPDGTVRWVRDRAFPVCNSAGAVFRLAGVAEDITERKAAEEHIREQACLLDLARDAITVRDEHHHLRYWNQGAEALYGWNAAEAVGRSVMEIIQPEPEEFARATQTVFTTGEWRGEIRHTARHGRELIVSSRWTLLRDALGQPRSILVIDTDITEKKRLEEQALRAQRMEAVAALAAGIAHDLNNILSPVLLSVSLLRLTDSPQSAASTLDTVEACAQRGAELVRQLLNLGRGAYTPPGGPRQPAALATLVGEVTRIARQTFPRNIIVHAVVAPDLPPVVGDPTELHRVLLNLCVNARDAMPEGGTLTLTAEPVRLDAATAARTPGAAPGRYVRLSVADTGTGIPPEIMDRIYEPFFTTKPADKGTGLGLSTVAGIVKNCGGFLSLHSALGRGTTFFVHLPLRLE